jgi:hypothetical protein
MSTMSSTKTLSVEESRGALWRLQAVFFRPGSAFTDIDRKPTWAQPLLAAGLVCEAEMYVFYSPKHTPFGFLASFLLAAIPVLLSVTVSAGCFWLALCIKGGETSFKKVFAVFAHSFFMYTVITKVLTAAVFFSSSDPSRIDPRNVVASNPGFLVSSKDHLALEFLLSSFDLVVFYHLFIITLGLSIVTRRISFKSAMWLTIAIYALYVGIEVAIKAAVA